MNFGIQPGEDEASVTGRHCASLEATGEDDLVWTEQACPVFQVSAYKRMKKVLLSREEHELLMHFRQLPDDTLRTAYLDALQGFLRL